MSQSSYPRRRIDIIRGRGFYRKQHRDATRLVAVAPVMPRRRRPWESVSQSLIVLIDPYSRLRLLSEGQAEVGGCQHQLSVVLESLSFSCPAAGGKFSRPDSLSKKILARKSTNAPSLCQVGSREVQTNGEDHCSLSGITEDTFRATPDGRMADSRKDSAAGAWE